MAEELWRPKGSRLAYQDLISATFSPPPPLHRYLGVPLVKQSTSTFVIRESGSSWLIEIDDGVFSFTTREDAVNAAINVAHDLDVPVDIFVETGGSSRELVWTSDQENLLQDLFRIWLAAGQRSA